MLQLDHEGWNYLLHFFEIEELAAKAARGTPAKRPKRSSGDFGGVVAVVTGGGAPETRSNAAALGLVSLGSWPNFLLLP